MTHLASPARPARQRRHRGFVILVVVMLLAVATAIAANQYTVVTSQTVTSTRVDEELQARAIAEGCLALMQTYTEGYIGKAPGFKKPDFDGLLDRAAGPADDYLPAFGTRVVLPRNLALIGAAAAPHQWSFLARGVAPNQGACLMRLEDNSDDGPASVPTGTTSATEGLGRDVANLDRDRAVYMTVIGLYPLLPGTTGDFAYERAHSRVTLRRLYAVENPPQAPPALQACGDVNLSSNTKIQGLGGVEADKITVSGGSTCGCGAYVANTVSPTAPPTACNVNPATCTPPTTTAGAPSACTTPTLPDSTYYMDNKGFGNPGSDTNNVGDPAACKVYIDRWGRSFVWDMTDSYANDPNDAANPLRPYVVPTLGVPTAKQTIPNLPKHNCKNYQGPVDTLTGRRIVELPCEWDTVGTGPADESVTCDFTNPVVRKRQTPCWKPIAYLGDSTDADHSFNKPNYMTSDVWLGPVPASLGYGTLNTVLQQSEMSSNENDEDLMFIKNVRIPNLRDSSKRFATGSASTTMCGDPGGCADCTGNDVNAWWTECSKRPTVPGDNTNTCTNFHSHQHQNSDNIPWPIIFAWDVDPASLINFEFAPGATKPLNATVLTNGKIQFSGDVSFCCATCGTGGNCTAPSTSPGIAGKFIPPANCVAGNSQVPAPSFFVPPPVPGPVQFRPSGYGYAFKADGVCEIAGNSTVIGDIECQAMKVPGNPCVVGNVQITGSSTAVGCGDPTCPDVGVCIGGNPQVLGDIYSQGSVCAPSNGTLKGDIFTMKNVSFSSNFALQGRVFANEDIYMSSNSTVLFNDLTQVLSAGNQGLTTFMETSW